MAATASIQNIKANSAKALADARLSNVNADIAEQSKDESITSAKATA